MKVTIDGITYEGSIDEIREIVRNPPTRSSNDWEKPVEFPNDDFWPKHDRVDQDWWWTRPMKIQDPIMGPDLTCIGGIPNTVHW